MARRAEAIFNFFVNNKYIEMRVEKQSESTSRKGQLEPWKAGGMEMKGVRRHWHRTGTQYMSV